MSDCGTSSEYDTLSSGYVRDPSEQDVKISERDFDHGPLYPGSHVVSIMHAYGEMAAAIENADPDGYMKAAKKLVVASFKVEFDPENGVTLRIKDPENDFGLTTGEVQELVQGCFDSPPANLQIQVSQVRFGFEVTISLSH